MRLARLTSRDITATELAGERIDGVLTHAPGNNAAIGGLKVVTANGWFAARPSGTEELVKIYAESFKGEHHLARIALLASESKAPGTSTRGRLTRPATRSITLAFLE